MQKRSVSTIWPIKVEEIVLSHNHFPFVLIFNFDKVIEFENSPARYAIRLAITIRGIKPKIDSYAIWLFHPSAEGKNWTITKIIDMRNAQKNPVQITLLDLLYP